MKRVLVCVLLFAAAFAVTLLLTGRRSAPPERVRADELARARDFLTAQRDLVARRSEMDGSAELRLDAAETRLLLLAAAGERGDRLERELGGFAVEVEDGRLELRLDLDSELLLGSGASGPLSKVLEGARSLGGRELPLHVSGLPVASDGQLGLALDDLEVRLGSLPVPLDTLVPPDRRPALAAALRLEIPGLAVETVTVEGDELVLGARPAT